MPRAGHSATTVATIWQSWALATTVATIWQSWALATMLRQFDIVLKQTKNSVVGHISAKYCVEPPLSPRDKLFCLLVQIHCRVSACCNFKNWHLWYTVVTVFYFFLNYLPSCLLWYKFCFIWRAVTASVNTGAPTVSGFPIRKNPFTPEIFTLSQN